MPRWLTPTEEIEDLARTWVALGDRFGVLLHERDTVSRDDRAAWRDCLDRLAANHREAEAVRRRLDRIMPGGTVLYWTAWGVVGRKITSIGPRVVLHRHKTVGAVPGAPAGFNSPAPRSPSGD